MKKRSLRTVHLILTALLLCACVPVLAEESHGHFELKTFLGQVINFVVLFGGLAYLLRKPIGNYLQGRVEHISALLEHSEAKKIDSKKKLEEATSRLNRLEDEINALKRQVEELARRESETIMKEAESEASRLRKLAAEEIEAMTRLSLQELKAYAINLSVALAEQKIKEKMTPEMHRKLIRRALDRLRSIHDASPDN
ncbi:MAG: ATP synthase F0 subunit B [Candidatus Saccharicenans sp.]